MAARTTEDIRLGRLELQIMNAVWEHGEASVHDVKDALGSGRKPAYSTVLTMMRKLEAKGYLAHETRDRAFVYRPVLEKGEARRNLLGALVDRLFGGSPAQLVNSLVEDGRVSAAELAEIRRILGKRRG